jgi:hypothetical protein
VSDLKIAEVRKWTTVGRSIVQATSYSRMFSPHCECVVALRHVEKHLVCLEVTEALSTTPTCQVDNSTIFSQKKKVLTFYACMQKLFF